MYVGVEVTTAVLEQFYQKHDAAKIPEVPKILAKHKHKTFKLVVG